ncbi:FAD/NAD(P)-binding oxidoreductase [Erwinia sp. BNK-24-b]|uniref:NAD(P)/FAD-dependent oxidoreductase n=1 Tax=unclassified Erwinia TaxID=2622719 RepID=UPI0039BF499C
MGPGNAKKPAHLVVIGGGTAGVGLIASLKKRVKNLNITLIEPNENHFYQPAWTLVGAGLYHNSRTARPLAKVIPAETRWIQEYVASVSPEQHAVTTQSGRVIDYDYLVIASGLVLRWDRIAGLEETLGRNGVTSNYQPGLAAYTWELVKELKSGNAIFSQPKPPFKCAGAPQKALYLSCEHWQKTGRLNDINVSFNLAGEAIFSVPYFIPVLKSYLDSYTATVTCSSSLVKVDGEKRLATFHITEPGQPDRHVEQRFDMLHVVPPQTAPDFIAKSGLANVDGWCDVHSTTLQHQKYPDIFSLGDCCSAPASKTAAAARKQIVVVAENLRNVMQGKEPASHYDGYGSCPLTVKRGKVVLAEYGYNNRLLPTFPLEPSHPSRLAWFLTTRFLPVFYWRGLLKGVEWFARSKQPDR